MFTPSEIQQDESTNKYNISDNGFNYSIDNPEFVSNQVYSNFIFRWEYKPGSVISFIWTYRYNHGKIPGDWTNSLATLNSYDRLADNVFLIKFSYLFLK